MTTETHAADLVDAAVTNAGRIILESPRYRVCVDAYAGGRWIDADELTLGENAIAVRLRDTTGEVGPACLTAAELEAERKRRLSWLWL